MSDQLAEEIYDRQQEPGEAERKEEDERRRLSPLVGLWLGECGAPESPPALEPAPPDDPLSAARVLHPASHQRVPPRSKWARKKFSLPAVAIAAEALISSARAVAATSWASR
jgi:hypothetical protein